jgi:magnesium transporter
MNFRHLPELEWAYGYHGFWVICLATAGGMLAWFRRRGWI